MCSRHCQHTYHIAEKNDLERMLDLVLRFHSNLRLILEKIHQIVNALQQAAFSDEKVVNVQAKQSHA